MFTKTNRQWERVEKTFVVVRWKKSYSHFSLFRSKSARSSASSGRRRGRSMIGAIPLHFRIVVFGWCAIIVGRVLFLISYFVFLSVSEKNNARILIGFSKWFGFFFFSNNLERKISNRNKNVAIFFWLVQFKIKRMNKK